MLQNGKDWKEISEELSVEAKARPVSVFTVDTRPGTTASLASCVQNSAQSHFVSQISEQEAIQFLNRKKTAEKPSISIEDAIKKISTSSSRIDPERAETEEELCEGIVCECIAYLAPNRPSYSFHTNVVHAKICKFLE